ncbi:MAG: shikimate kinase [Bacteroidales bacterium]|nr:shikimate kinase [Bacteroidales bacterium]
MIITLTGFMGCGKSSVGRRLSELLCCPFMDLDSIIEEYAGKSIPEIFATEGEAAFRQMELEALRTIIGHSDSLSAPLAPSHSIAAGPSPYPGVGKCQFRTSDYRNDSKRHLVIALGGGTVMTPECAELVQNNTRCIYLKASVETLVEHLDNEADKRPLLSGGDLRTRIENLMSRRSATYERTAHMIIDTDGKTVDEIASAISYAWSTKH